MTSTKDSPPRVGTGDLHIERGLALGLGPRMCEK